MFEKAIWLVAKNMLTCPKCRTHIPEGMRFCLQCGAPLTSPPLAAQVAVSALKAPPPPRSAADAESVTPRLDRSPQPLPSSSAAKRNITPSPTLSRPFRLDAENPRPSLGDPMMEIDEESLRKAFEPVSPPGATLCRFCKRPLDLSGDFCEQCGAPVSEAAPPGALRSR